MVWICADGFYELVVPAFEGEGVVEAHEGGVGWVGDAGGGEVAVEIGGEVADEVGAFHELGMVLEEPGGGGGADAAGEGAVAGEVEVAGFADFFFECEGDGD